MARTLTFDIIGDMSVSIFAEEGDFDSDGYTDIRFTVSVDESGGQTADLRALMWDVADEDKLAAMSVAGSDVTNDDFGGDRVRDLGQGANLNGAITNKGRGFDAGVRFGTPGTGRDDIQTTTFVLRAEDMNLTLDDIGGQRFGVRLTSVGDIGGSREDSLKFAEFATYAPDALDDALTTDEDTAAGLNLLFNDEDGDGDTLSVTEIDAPGATVGSTFAVLSDGGRAAQVSVAADGTFSVDPNGQFDDLAVGDVDSFTLTYTISDGNGGADCAEVVVTIEGVNDAPVAADDGSFFVEAGDTAMVDVLANDFDVDGVVVPGSLAFSGDDLGVASNVGGQLSYAANPIPYDAVDSSARDALTYTVEDDQGATSNAASVEARVIDPLRETDLAQAVASNGQTLSLGLSTEDRTFNDSSFLEVDISASDLADQNVNVVFIWDGSGSLSATDYAAEVAAVQQTINLLRAEFAGSAADVDVKLIQFSSSQSGFDALRESGSLELNSGLLDNISALPLTSQISGGTDYAPPLTSALNFLTPQASEDNFVFFASDGRPNFNNFAATAANLQAIADVQAFGFGSAAAADLNIVDSDTAVIAPSVSDLANAFATSPLFAADLLDFSLAVSENGAPAVELFDESDLTPLGAGSFSLDGVLTGLLNGLGDGTLVEATATFDTDNDGIGDQTLTAQTTINGTDGTDVLFA